MSDNMNDSLFAVILAAGEGSRFGRLKQIEPVNGTTLLGIVVGNALRCAGLARIVLVLGAGADAVKDALGSVIDDDRLETIINDDYAEGMGISLRAGLEAARRGGCDAALILLGDMPAASDTDMLDAMITRYRSSGRALCYVKTEDRPGHPIIAGKDLFDEFMKIEGDTGGREIVRKHIDSALGVEVDIDGIDHQLDIDEEEDLLVYRSLIGRRHAS